MDYKGIIFDLDGTLLDSMEVWLNAGKYYLKALGFTAEENLGEKLMEMNMEQGALYLKNQYNIKLTPEEIISGINDVICDLYRKKIQLKKGVLDFLQYLKDHNIPMTVATSTDKEVFLPCLERNGILSYFSAILTCSELSTSKEKPDIYFKAAQIMGTTPQETVVFEDAPYALETARKAGFPTAGVYDSITATSTDEEKIRCFSSFYIEDFSSASCIIFPNHQ